MHSGFCLQGHYLPFPLVLGRALAAQHIQRGTDGSIQGLCGSSASPGERPGQFWFHAGLHQLLQGLHLHLRMQILRAPLHQRGARQSLTFLLRQIVRFRRGMNLDRLRLWLHLLIVSHFYQKVRSGPIVHYVRLESSAQTF